jgi:hypothetical protein
MKPTLPSTGGALRHFFDAALGNFHVGLLRAAKVAGELQKILGGV